MRHTRKPRKARIYYKVDLRKCNKIVQLIYPRFTAFVCTSANRPAKMALPLEKWAAYSSPLPGSRLRAYTQCKTKTSIIQASSSTCLLNDMRLLAFGPDLLLAGTQSKVPSSPCQSISLPSTTMQPAAPQHSPTPLPASHPHTAPCHAQPCFARPYRCLRTRRACPAHRHPLPPGLPVWRWWQNPHLVVVAPRAPAD